MTDFVYDTEALRRDAVVARAMGHYSGTLRFRNGEEKVVWFKPDGTPIEGLPRFHTDRDALAEAMTWLRSQHYAIRETFIDGAMTSLGHYHYETKKFHLGAMALLTAPTHVLARALAEAIEGGGAMITISDASEIKLPDSFRCPICNAALYIEEVNAWTEGDGGSLKAEAVKVDCVTFPGFDDHDAFEAYMSGHYSMPYVDWLPLETEITAWVNERYVWEL